MPFANTHLPRLFNLCDFIYEPCFPGRRHGDKRYRFDTWLPQALLMPSGLRCGEYSLDVEGLVHHEHAHPSHSIPSPEPPMPNSLVAVLPTDFDFCSAYRLRRCLHVLPLALWPMRLSRTGFAAVGADSQPIDLAAPMANRHHRWNHLEHDCKFNAAIVLLC